MTLWLSEDDARALLPMEEALRVVEEAFRALGRGEATNHPRRRHRLPAGVFHEMDAAFGGFVGVKAYTTTREANRFHMLLYDARSGELAAVLEADWIGRLRTGAMTGVATRLLARADAATLGIIGTGRQARTQVEAITRVRPIRRALAFSRAEENRRSFASGVSQALGIVVEAVASAEETVRRADIIVTATWSKEPVLRGAWLRPGQHINAIGSNHADRRELNDEAVRRADRIVVDEIATAKIESGDLLGAGVDWSRVEELGPLVVAEAPARRESDITLFKSHGLAVLDVAAAAFVFSRARERGVGRGI